MRFSQLPFEGPEREYRPFWHIRIKPLCQLSLRHLADTEH
jgi:hypothetical protein